MSRAAPPPVAYNIAKSQSTAVLIAGRDSVTVGVGAAIATASYTDPNAPQDAAIWDATGGGNTVVSSGVTQAFVGMWFNLGSNTVTLKAGALSDGPNAGIEFHRGGHNVLNVSAGATVSSHDYGVWIGPPPHIDQDLFTDAGSNTITDYGSIIGTMREAIHLSEGGNAVVIGAGGLVQSYFEQAIEQEGADDTTVNRVDNNGTITAGPRGPAVLVTTSTEMDVLNRPHGVINGDIDFGGGNDLYWGGGTLTGTIYGNDGNDTISAGTGAVTIVGGAGADLLTAGTGADIFAYNGASESTGTVCDTIRAFDFRVDHLEVGGHLLTSFDEPKSQVTLAAHHAGIFAAANGNVILEVDMNGVAGYQAGADLRIVLVGALHVPGGIL